MTMERFEVLPLHQNKHLIKQCFALIHSEWPARNEKAPIMERYFSNINNLPSFLNIYYWFEIRTKWYFRFDRKLNYLYLQVKLEKIKKIKFSVFHKMRITYLSMFRNKILYNLKFLKNVFIIEFEYELL